MIWVMTMTNKSVAAALCLIVTVAACNAAKPDDGFEAIRAEVCAGNYDAALPKLKAYRGKHESRAGLFLGKIAMVKGDFAEAKREFQRVVDTFPGSDEHHKCRYKLAVVAMLEGDRDSARKQFQALADKPDGPLAPEATAMAEFLSE